MAAPFVSGIAALIFATNPKLSAVDVKQIIVSTARHVISKRPDGSSADIRMPDAEAALKLARSFSPTPYETPSAPETASSDPPDAGKPSNEPMARPQLAPSSGGCALHRSSSNPWTSAPTPWRALLLTCMLAPFAISFALRKRDASLCGDAEGVRRK
jgi:hypothetical protein